MRQKNLFRALLTFALAGTLAACGMTTTTTERGSIAEIAADNGNFTILLAALTEADLAATFADDEAGPFTVFAPTDAAFEALLADLNLTPAELLASPDLADILTYHVASGSLLFSEVAGTSAIPTLNGITLNQSGGVLDGYSTIVDGDIVASNGVIHVIDAVLQPKDVVDVAITDGRFTTLVTALVQEGLVETLRGAGPFTVFAPTDDGFGATLDALGLTATELLALPNLTDILLYHVVAADPALDAAAVVGSAPGTVGTVEGSDLSYAVVDGGVVLNGSVNVVITDVLATNGIIHAIDFVLLPPTP